MRLDLTQSFVDVARPIKECILVNIISKAVQLAGSPPGLPPWQNKRWREIISDTPLNIVLTLVVRETAPSVRCAKSFQRWFHSS